MTGKQNILFFLGLTLIIVNGFASGNIQMLWKGIFTPNINKQPPVKILMPKSGKCPPGYSKQPTANGGFECMLHSHLPM